MYVKKLIMKGTSMKKLGLCLLAIALVLSLAGCSTIANLLNSDFDASLYVKGKLDVMYVGEASDEFFDILEDGGRESATEQYEEVMEIQYKYLTSYYMDIYTEYLSEETVDLCMGVVKDIYAKANYEVAAANKAEDGSFNVNVTVTPITILVDFFDKYYDALYDDYYEKYYEAFNAEMSDEEYEDLLSDSEEYYTTLVFTKLREMIDNGELSYGKPEIFVVRVYEESKNLFTVSDTDITSIDSIIMTYPS